MDLWISPTSVFRALKVKSRRGKGRLPEFRSLSQVLTLVYFTCSYDWTMYKSSYTEHFTRISNSVNCQCSLNIPLNPAGMEEVVALNVGSGFTFQGTRTLYYGTIFTSFWVKTKGLCPGPYRVVVESDFYSNYVKSPLISRLFRRRLVSNINRYKTTTLKL